MKILEFGDTSKNKIVLIHGFQCPWQVWNKYIEHYKNKFHIIVPIMSGHNPEFKDDFISFASDAKKIEEYILSRYGKHIYAVYGMSMGGVLAATLWQNNRLSFDKVIFDGSPIVSYNAVMKIFMKKFYVNITHKSQQRDKKTLEQATKVIVSEDNLGYLLEVLDNMSDVTVENSIDGISDFKLSRDINTIPIEVKAKNSKAKSLDQLIKSDKYSDISYGIKFCAGNVGFENNIYTFPYYCTFLLTRYLKEI